MSDIKSIVADLVAAGCSPEAAAQAVAQAFTAGVASAPVRGMSADETAERRREKDRLRKREQRGNPQTSADVGGNPQMSENASLSKEVKIEIIKEERGAVRASVRGQRLPENWEPSPQDRATAAALIGDRTAGELDKFRDHWKQQPGTKGVKLDWDAAWRNWTRRAAEYGGKNGHGSFNAKGRSASSDFFAGIASVAADIAGNGAASGPASEEIPLGRHNIDG